MNPFSDADLVVASDLHVKDPHDSKGVLLSEALQQIATGKVKQFCLLGDVFDFCLGSNPYFRKKFSTYGAALEKVSKTGTKVTFVEGNHEFAMSQMGWQHCNITSAKDLVIDVENNGPVAFSHGDLIHCKWHYRVFRWAIKSPLSVVVAGLVPGKLLDRYALWQAKTSRSYDDIRKLNHRELFKDALLWLDQKKTKTGIIGHFHVPYHEQLTDSRLLLSMDCWELPNFLIFKNGKIDRIYFKNGKWVQQDSAKNKFAAFREKPRLETVP